MNTEPPEDEEVICLVCGKPFHASVVKRGLCAADYQKFDREKRKATKEERKPLEQLLIAEGKLLPDGRSADNPFADALQRIREANASDTAQQLANEVNKLAEPKADPTVKARKKKGT